MIVFDCPHCGKHFSFSDRFGGRNMMCSGCKNEIHVPEPEEELGLASVSKEETPPESILSMTLPEILPSSALPPAPPPIAETPPLPPVPPPLPPTLPPVAAPSLPDPLTESDFPSFPDLGPSLDLPSFPDPIVAGPSLPPTPPPIPDRFAAASPEPFLQTGADDALLAYVYEEKHKGEIITSSNPGELERPEMAPRPESLLVKNLMYWGSIGTALLLILGISLYLALFVDWSGKDPRPAILEQITQQKNQAIIEAKNKEMESELLRARSLTTWNKTEEFIDAFVIAQGERDDKAMDVADLDGSIRQHAQNQGLVQELTRRREEAALALQTVDERMAELRKRILAGTEEASGQEQGADQALLEGELLRKAANHYELQEKDLSAKIRDLPASRESFMIDRFDLDRNRRALEHKIDLMQDWTENYFSYFDFPGSAGERFFAGFDAARLGSGLRSLRISSLERAPITILLPKDRKARNALEKARYFSFSFRVPELRDSIFLGSHAESGKIGEYRIRFGNSAGYVEFQTTSPRYCEALFFEARGKFFAVEFPLTGDSFWLRNDQFDMSKFHEEDDIDNLLSGDAAPEGQETEKELSFFSRIDWVEIRLMPLSDRTTVWLDEMQLSSNNIRGSFDLLRTESLQGDARRREREFFERQQTTRQARKVGTMQRQTLPDSAEDIEFIDPEADDDATMPENAIPPAEPSAQNRPLDFEGSTEHRIARLCQWVLENAQGQVRLRMDGRQITLGPRSRIPASLVNTTVEEIDVSGFQNLSENQLAQIGDFRDMKRLNLARTGLKDGDTNKLSALVALESLDLSGNKISYEALLGIRTLAGLQELNLEGIGSSAKGLETFRSLTALQSLNLSRSGAGISDMMYLITLEKLETLNLSVTQLGDRAANLVANLGSLKNLDMSRTQITDQGIAALEGLSRMETLRLNNTAVTNGCLTSLKKMPKLESVSALKTGITREGVRRTLGADWLPKFKLD